MGQEAPLFWRPGGRLTLTSGAPIPTSPVTGAPTAYYTEYEDSVLPLWDGRRYVPHDIPYRPGTTVRELAIPLSTVVSATPHDVFARTCRGRPEAFVGPAWSGSTARSAAGAVVRVGGRLALRSDPRCLLLGTVYGSGTGTTEDSLSSILVWNAFNRVERVLRAYDTENNWTYTLTTIRAARGAPGEAVGVGRVQIMLGAPAGYGELVTAVVRNICSNSGWTFCSGGVGIDSTTVNSATIHGGSAAGGGLAQNTDEYRGHPGIGFHYIQRLEWSTASGTTQWSGDEAGTVVQTGMEVVAWL